MWKKFKRWIVGVVAAVAAFFGVQQAVMPQERVDTLTWELATSYEDGQVLPPELIGETLIQWGNSPGGPYNVGSQRVPAPQTSTTVPVAQRYGTTCYIAFTVLTDGTMSINASNEACKTVMPPPSNPRNLQVQ